MTYYYGYDEPDRPPSTACPPPAAGETRQDGNEPRQDTPAG